jgi:hypothetical protein
MHEPIVPGATAVTGIPAELMRLAGLMLPGYGDGAVVFGKTGGKPERPSPL